METIARMYLPFVIRPDRYLRLSALAARWNSTGGVPGARPGSSVQVSCPSKQQPSQRRSTSSSGAEARIQTARANCPRTTRSLSPSRLLLFTGCQVCNRRARHSLRSHAKRSKRQVRWTPGARDTRHPGRTCAQSFARLAFAGPTLLDLALFSLLSEGTAPCSAVGQSESQGL